MDNHCRQLAALACIVFRSSTVNRNSAVWAALTVRDSALASGACPSQSVEVLQTSRGMSRWRKLLRRRDNASFTQGDFRKLARPLNPLNFLESHNRNHPNWTHYCLGWEGHRSLPQSNKKGGKDRSEDQRHWASRNTGHLSGKSSTQIIKHLNNGLRARTSRLRESFLHQVIRLLNSTWVVGVESLCWLF